MKLSSFLQMKPNLFVCEILGWRLTSCYVELLGRLYFWAKREEKRKFELSIYQAFEREKDATEIRELHQRVLRGVFLHYCEKLFNVHSSAEELKSFLSERVEEGGTESLDAALHRGKGVLFVTGHYGGVEFIPGYLATRGYPVAIVVRFSSEDLRKKSFAKAAQFHTHIIDVDRTPNILKAVSENLKENRVVVTQCDEVEEWRNAGQSTNWFLGKHVTLDRTLNVIVRRTDASVVFGIMERGSDQKYKLIMRSMEELMKQFASAMARSPSAMALKLLEQHIYACPEQWYQWGKYAQVKEAPAYSFEFKKGKFIPYLNPATG